MADTRNTSGSRKPLTYAVKHRNYDIRMNSRSGGIFTALSDSVLREGGAVYGCVLEGNSTAVHIRAENAADRDRMRGSKYIQSDMRKAFSEAKSDLEAGRSVLFSGTSCQIAGLRAYLGKEYEKLLCVDIVCHGVPSPEVWKDYLEYLEKTNGGKISEVSFRNKKDFGWKAHVESVTLEDGRQIDSKVFKKLFYDHYILRPCCHKCPYKGIMHPGDITIADYWGIDKAVPGFNDDKGVSLVLINNSRGKSAFEAVSGELEAVKTRIEDSIQPPLKAPFPAPPDRAKFWQDYRDKGIAYIVKKYGTVTFTDKVKGKVKRILSRK